MEITQKKLLFTLSSAFQAIILLQLLQILPVTNSQLATSTKYDGVTFNVNKYLKFEGTNGVSISEPIDSLTSYSASIWFRLSVAPWGSLNSDMFIVEFSPTAFSVVAARSNDIEFRSSKFGTLSLDGSQIRLAMWYIVTITSSKRNYSIQLKSMAGQLLSSKASGSFFPTGYSSLSFSEVHIGLNSAQKLNYFQGNIRNLRLLQTELTDTQLWNIQFVKLYPSIDLRI